MHYKSAPLARDGAASAERVTNALESLPFGRGQKQLAAEVFVSHLLDNLPLDSQQRRDILPGSLPTLLNSFQLLGSVPHQARYQFFTQVVDRALSPGKRKELPFLAAVLTQAGYWLHAAERRNLLLDMSQRKSSGAAAKCWVALARSAKSVEEVYRRVQGCGRERLLAFSSRELKEFIVMVEVMAALRSISLPEKPSPYATNPVGLLERARQLQSSLHEAQRFLHGMPWAKGTTGLSRFNVMLKASEKVLAEQLESASTPGARNRALRANIERIGLELRFGKSFTHDPTRPWTESELNVVSAALADTGEYRNVCSPVVKIHRSAGLEDACGVISNCGTSIELEDRCFAKGKVASEVRGGCSPKEIVIHELGHSFSMVPVDTVLRRVRKTGGANVNELFLADHFPEIFLRLGRWGGMTTSFQVDEAGVVRVQGEEIPLDQPLQVDGEQRVYRHNPQYRCLYWYDHGRGEFPRRADSQADPTECFPEGFSDYYEAPRELIEHAPHVFWYFESIYHHYDRDQNVFDRLRERLKSKALPEPLHVPVEVDAFALLQRSEQLSILKKAGLAPRRWERELPRRDEREAVLLRACVRGQKRRVVERLLHDALADYRPALLLARAALFSGDDVAVASIRGSSSSTRDTQERLRKDVAAALGPQFDERSIFLLSDVKKSARFRSKSYHEKLVSLITMRLNGYEPRPDGQHKKLEKSYQQVILYTDIFPTMRYVEGFARRQNISDKISIVSPRKIDSSDAAWAYLKANPRVEAEDRQILHLFVLEDLIHLPAKFYVRLTGGRVLRELSVKEFLLHPNPDYWRTIVAAQSQIYRKRDLVFDDSEFTEEAPLAQFLKDGHEDAMMFKRRT